MTEPVLVAALAAALAAVAAILAVLHGRRLEARIARLLREEAVNDRAEAQSLARALRAELADGATRSSQSQIAQLSAMSGAINSQLEGFAGQLGALSTANERRFTELRETVDAKLREAKDDARTGREENAAGLKRFADALGERFAEVRQTLETQLAALQKDNAEKLEAMRVTVDEKLHATLEARLGEAFKSVAERLDAVHKGLGEMQALAADVGSLQRVLTGVKTRGTWGEVQLGALLEQMLTAGQYESNVATRPDGRERVEFAIRLPGKETPVWLPIDAKFPREDYERLVLAQERADPEAIAAAGRAIEARLKLEAKTIREKYVEPPHTTDFAILYLPTEGLYAEALRIPGLADALQREQRILLAGPTTLAALLNSLQMGFRTLAIEQRSAEVWKLLGAVRSEFGKFGEVLARVKAHVQTVANTLESAETRTRQMERKLKSVESLPAPEAQHLLGADED